MLARQIVHAVEILPAQATINAIPIQTALTMIHAKAMMDVLVSQCAVTRVALSQLDLFSNIPR